MTRDDSEQNVVNPDELDVSESNHVVSLENDRYLVSSTPIDTATERRIVDAASEGVGDTTGTGDIPSLASARRSLTKGLSDAEGRYAIEAIGCLEGTETHHRTITNDVTTAFERLLEWFAQHVGDDVAIERAMEILLLNSSLPQPVTPADIRQIMEEEGLDDASTIGELLGCLDDSQDRP